MTAGKIVLIFSSDYLITKAPKNVENVLLDIRLVDGFQRVYAASKGILILPDISLGSNTSRIWERFLDSMPS